MEIKSAALRSFRHRNFRILYPANLISNIGSWAQRTAQDWLVLELTHSGRELGIVVGLQFLPIVFLSLYAGLLADRMNRRKLLIWINLAGGMCSIILGLLVITHVVQMWHVYLLVFLFGISGALDGPVRQSFNFEVVGREDVPNAVSLNSANFNFGRLLGPGLSGLAIAAFGTGPSFIFNGLTYVFVIAALISMRERELHREARASSDSKISEALAYVKARTDLRAVMTTAFFTATFGLNFTIFHALMATKVFGKQAAEYGILGTLTAIGSLGAAVISARLDRKRGPRFVIASAFTFGASIMVISFAPSYLTYALFAPICGFTALSTMIAANSYVQISSDQRIRGRVMGLYFMVFMGGGPIGSPFIGWLTTQIGVRQTLFVCGAVVSFCAALIASLFRGRLHMAQVITMEKVLDTPYHDK